MAKWIQQLAGEVDDPVVMCGFPKSGLDKYTGKLVRAGQSVSIAFQDEQKKSADCAAPDPDNCTPYGIVINNPSRGTKKMNAESEVN